jgi:hypothetical protein
MSDTFAPLPLSDLARPTEGEPHRRAWRVAAIGASALVVVAVVVGAAVLRPRTEAPAAAHPAAPPSPETQLALTIARPAASGAQVTQAAYVVATPKAIESVLHPGEDNLQRLIPAGHQMLVIELAGTFSGAYVHSPPSMYNRPNPNFTSSTIFCDAVTGRCVSYALAGGSTPDVVADLSRFGTPVVLKGL